MKEKRNVPITFRLTESEFEPFSVIMKETEMSKSDLCRSVFLSRKDEVKLKPTNKAQLKRKLILLNRIDRRINKVAKQLSSNSSVDNKRAVNELINLQCLLTGFINAR